MAPPTPQWKGRQSLELVCRFNQRSFQLIGEALAGGSDCDIPALTDNRDLWTTMDHSARTRAGRFPFVILDARFADTEWWRDVIEGRPNPPATRRDGGLSEQLMEETLLFAAQTVKWDSSVARLMLGMSPTVAHWLIELSPQNIANIWRQHSAALQIRWHDKPQFWQGLLSAAINADEEALARIRTEAQLMFCADLFQLRS